MNQEESLMSQNKIHFKVTDFDCQVNEHESKNHGNWKLAHYWTLPRIIYRYIFFHVIEDYK